jgi:hypothetical protein
MMMMREKMIFSCFPFLFARLTAVRARQMLMLSALLLVALAMVSAKNPRNEDDPLRVEKLSEDALAGIEAEFEALYKDAIVAAHETSDKRSRRSRDSSYRATDKESYGGANADRHARRVPIFQAAYVFGANVTVKALERSIRDHIRDCDSPRAELAYCEKAVACLALHGITHHWEKLHLREAACQAIVTQFNGGKKKEAFNPDDRGALKDAFDEVREDILPALAVARQKYRLICEKDFKCNQKIDCYLTKGIAEAFPSMTKIVRCPYGEFEESSISSSTSLEVEEVEEAAETSSSTTD